MRWSINIYEGPALFAAVLSSIFTFTFGLWIALPWDAFHGRPAYMLMATIMPQLAWGIAFMLVGAGRLLGILFDRFLWVRVSAFVTFLAWLVAAACFIISDWQAPIVTIGVFLAIQAAHHYIMVKQPKNLPNNKNASIV